jgi:hypothetical protein
MIATKRNLSCAPLLLAVGLLLGEGGASAATVTWGVGAFNPSVQIVHGKVSGFTCPGGGVCTFPVTKSMGAGYDVADVIMTGFTVQWSSGNVNRLRRFDLGFSKPTYDTSSGLVSFTLSGEIREHDLGSEPWTVGEVHFVLVVVQISLGGPTALLNDGPGQCEASDTDTCTFPAVPFPGGWPAGNHFSGFGPRHISFHLKTSDPKGFAIHKLGLDLSNYSHPPGTTDVSVTPVCQFGDSTPIGEQIGCNVDVVSITVPTGDMQAIPDIPPLAPPVITPTYLFSQSVNESLGATDVVGVMGGLTRFLLQFTDGTGHPIWRWDAGFKNISTTLGSPDVFNYTYTGFMGTISGNTASTSQFSLTLNGIKALLLP